MCVCRMDELKSAADGLEKTSERTRFRARVVRDAFGVDMQVLTCTFYLGVSRCDVVLL